MLKLSISPNNVGATRGNIRLLVQKRYNTSKSKSKAVAHLLPKVKDTNNLSQRIVNVEGLFAGYKPLFLGNGSIENVSGQVVEDFNSFLEPARNSLNGDAEEKLIPWDASVGGLIFNDEPFKNVPRDVVGKLRFFKAPKDLDFGSSTDKKSKFIQMKVHSPLVDEGLFDNYQANLRKIKNNKKKSKMLFTPGMTVDDAYDKMDALFMSVLYTDKLNKEFINEKELLLQYTLHNFKTKLNNELKTKHETELLSKTPIYKLPKYIFFQKKSISNELLFKKKLYKIFYKETHMLYEMLHGYRNTDYKKARFRKAYLRNIKRLVTTLCDKIYVNVSEFARADALVWKQSANNQSSKGSVYSSISSGSEKAKTRPFGRIYWFNPRRRFDMVIKKKNDLNFFKFRYFSYYPVNVRTSIMTPMTIVCKHGKEADTSKENVNDINENENKNDIGSDIGNDTRK